MTDTRTPRKPWRAAIIAAIVTFTVIAGATGSFAYWSATGGATLGVGAATLTGTTAGWSATTLGNETEAAASSASLSSTGSITFSNTTSTTSSQSQTLSATFSYASGDTTLAGATTLTAWYVASAASCTASATPVSPVSGTWSAGVTVSRSLAPGASATYCLRNTVADRQNVDSSTGTRTFTPQAVASLTISNFTASTTTTSAISTQYVYPLEPVNAATWTYIKRATTEWCWDVSGAATTAGTQMISYACKNNSDTNQDFRFVDADGDGYGEFIPRNSTGLRVEAATSTTSGSAVTVETANASDTTQQWQSQLVGTDTYQFVNRYSGLCISAAASSTAQLTQVTCSGTADQKFTFTTREVITFASETCTNSGGTTTGRTATYSWTTDYASGPYTVQVKRTTTGAWNDLVTTSASATTATVPAPIGTPLTTWGNSTGSGYAVQIVNAFGDVMATDYIQVARQGTSYYYARC